MSPCGLLADGLSYGVFALGAPLFYLHPKTRRDFVARLGLAPAPVKPSSTQVWFHGASAGDVRALLPIIEALSALHPHEARLTTWTDTGLAFAHARAGSALVSAVPFDAPIFVERFVRRARPDLLVLERAELWPQLIARCRQFGAAVAVVNGALRADRVGAHRRLLRPLGDVALGLDRVLARQPEDMERFAALGVPRSRITLMGDSKLDALRSDDGPSPELIEALGPGPLWAATSVHRDEELGFLRVQREVSQARPRVRLLLAPRYPARARSVLRAAHGLGLTAAPRSEGASSAQVVVLDTLGELSAALALVELAVVGGSFGRRGGQNPYEAAFRRQPQLFGPNMRSFASAAQTLVSAGAAAFVPSFEALPGAIEGLLEDPINRARMGGAGLHVVDQGRGASLRAASVLADLLEGRRSRA